MSSRLDRERGFHDRTFRDHGRLSAARFYSVTGAMLSWYGQAVMQHACGAKVLEYGCGPGSLAFSLANAGADVVGIDISPVAIEQANSRAQVEELAGALTFKVMDAENLDYPDRSFDMVCGSGILHHLDLERSYREVSRVLKPTGVGVFREPLGHNPLINLYRRLTPQLRTVDEHPLRMQDIELALHFFDEIHTEHFTLLSLAAIPLRGRSIFPHLLLMLDKTDQGLFRTMPSTRQLAWTVGILLLKPRAL